jgi:hypothetical protein
MLHCFPPAVSTQQLMSFVVYITERLNIGKQLFQQLDRGGSLAMQTLRKQTRPIGSPLDGQRCLNQVYPGAYRLRSYAPLLDSQAWETHFEQRQR